MPVVLNRFCQLVWLYLQNVSYLTILNALSWITLYYKLEIFTISNSNGAKHPLMTFDVAN